MAPPKKPSVADPYANMPEPPAQDPYADMPDAFAASKDNTEGIYQMQTPEGTSINVPYSKVMSASQSGYKISPDDRLKFGKDKLYELSGKGLKDKFNPDTDLPEAFNQIKAGTPWYRPTVKGTERKLLDLLPTAGAAGFGFLAGVPGAVTGPADIPITAGAAGVGAGGGEALRQTLSEKLFPFDSRLTPAESARGIGVQAGFGALAEGSGRAIGLAVNPALKYFRETAQASEKAGFRMLPSEARGKAPHFTERMLKGNILSGPQMERFRTAQNAETKAAVDKIADSISNFKGTPEELGQKVQEGIAQHKEQFRKLQNQMYEDIEKDVDERTVKVPIITQVPSGVLGPDGKPLMKNITRLQDQVIDNVMPSTKGLKAFAREKLAELDQQAKIMQPELLAKARGMLSAIEKSPDRVPFSTVKNARSDYLGIARQLDQALEGKAAGFAKKMSQLYDESMMDAAQKSGIPGLVDKVRAANKFTADEHQMFEQALVEKIVKTKKPEVIATMLRGNTIGNQETRDLFRILPEKLHDPVRRQLLVDTMRQSTDLNTKVFNERRFAEILGKMGDERGKIIFGKNWNNVKDLTAALSQINGPAGLEGGGSGSAFQNIAFIKNVLSLATGAAGGGFVGASGGPVGAGIGAAVGAAVGEGINLLGDVVQFRTLAYIMTHPETATKLIKGVHALIRGVPYITTTTINEAGGVQKGLDRVKAEAKRLQEKITPAPQPVAPVPQVQFAPDGSVIPLDDTGPQSKAKPWTHIFNPETGEIEAA
jgi:hypothetical protein